MAEYIERKKFLSRLNYICNAYGISKFLKEKFKKAIYDCTAADVVEVKHGEWIEIYNLVIEHGLPTVKGKTWRCSICGEARKKRTAPDMKYCPNCGAKMDLKEGAENE